MGELRTFNFINSIKGGCGKTTFSIFLTKYLNAVNAKTTDMREKSLLLDMDLQGTAMQHLFEGNLKDSDGKNGKGKKIKCLNEAVRFGGEVRDYVTEKRITGELVLDIVFANSNPEEKEKFRVSSKTGYSPTTQYNVFKGGLHRFLKKLKDMDYKHFIFDMPPNSDGFSGAALECVMNDAYNVKEKEDIVNLFFLTGFDSGQVNATFKEVELLLKNKDNFRYDHLFIVFNDNVVRREEFDADFFFRAYIEDFSKTVKEALTEEAYAKTYFLRMGAHEAYSTYCMEGKGLENLCKLVLNTTGQSIDDYIPNSPAIEFAEIEKDSIPIGGREQEFLKNKMIYK